MDFVAEVAPDIYQVRIPVPFPLKNVQCYMVREPGGWTMIDTGLHHPDAFEAWDRAFEALQSGPREIRRIILTHAHPDHYGLAGHFQNVSGAPVYALDREIEIIPKEWPDTREGTPMLTQFFGQHGAPREMLERISSRSAEVLQMVNPQPVLSPLREGETIEIGGRHYRLAWMPGHADGHMVLHREGDGLMFIGDHVLLKITPNIALWPMLDPNPLRSYLASLDKVARMPTHLALPGHRALIHDLPARVEEIKQHHTLRLEECRQAAGDGCTGYEVCRVIFSHLQSVDDVRMGMVETLSHLEYLVSEGRLERSGDEITCYRQLRSSSRTSVPKTRPSYPPSDSSHSCLG